MATRKVTARGQVTLGKDALRHLGIRPGDIVHLHLLPEGRAELKAVQASGTVKDLHGFLKGKTMAGH